DVGPAWRRSAFQPIGETTLDRLGARLANELQRGLCDAAADGARTRPVDLGDGAEVLSALWDAVARIRQLVTARARGTIRFAATGPAAALPTAPWLGGSPRTRPDRAAALGEVRRSERAQSLEGHTIVVADDDPSMSWFLSGVLREAGATVVEAFDGEQALDRIYRTIPDLVMSDIVMPEIDGYTLCRAVKRDVALRSCPVVLLSWKRDLLQRMRELGAEADGYLVKEASAREILQRIQELLSPQRSIARRLLEGGPVRGRLDGMSPFALLRTACQLRPDCRVTVRDAHVVFNIEVRKGRPVSATRTAEDGETERGAPVIIGMLGVGDGRFGVEPIDADIAVPHELSGTLEDQLKHPIALARAAQQLLRGQRLLGVERVQFDETALAPQVACTPEPARGLLHALLAGASPRTMIAEGRASAELLERVLDDAARRGAVRVVMDQRGEDVLLAGFERELAIVEGRGDRSAWREVALSLRGEEAPELWDEIDEPVEPVNNTPSDEVVVVDNRVLDVRTPSPPPPKVQSRAPDPHATTPLQASAVVSAGARQHTPILSTAVTSPARLAELDPSPVPEAPPIEQRDQTPTERKLQKRRRRRQEESPPAAMVAPEPPRLPLLPSAYVTRPREPEPEARRHRWLLPVLFGTAGIALAVGARWMREHRPAQPPMGPPMEEAATAPPAEKSVEAEATATEEPPEELPLAGEDKARLREGQALLEIVVGRQDQVFVDGKDAGRGPVVKIAVDAGDAPHEIRAKLRGEERVRYVTVRPGTRVRVRVAPPWSR
ncbi:MAG TPA: response regulator, partial [Polyangiaceae bacterium]|nr:response regulator [Polyangiaceae bacterium]